MVVLVVVGQLIPPILFSGTKAGPSLEEKEAVEEEVEEV